MGDLFLGIIDPTCFILLLIESFSTGATIYFTDCYDVNT